MSDLDKAREWAKAVDGHEDLMSEPRAAVEVIQSLPDKWVDVEKVRGIIDTFIRESDNPASSSNVRRVYRECSETLDLLLTPKLPTLAELIKQGNDPEQYRWTQAKVFHTGEQGCVTDFDLYREIATVIFPNGVVKSVPYEDITPLTGEPKLEFPGSVVDCEIVDEPEPVNAPPAEKAALPKPEDVPANEPWLIEVADGKAIGTRYAGDSVVPWSVAALDGLFAGDSNDSEVTLIHKLVSEPPALPKGMRLADHEEYGRVIALPKAHKDGDYKIFFPFHGGTGSARVKHKNELTFLGGADNG